MELTVQPSSQNLFIIDIDIRLSEGIAVSVQYHIKGKSIEIIYLNQEIFLLAGTIGINGQAHTNENGVISDESHLDSCATTAGNLSGSDQKQHSRFVQSKWRIHHLAFGGYGDLPLDTH